MKNLLIEELKQQHLELGKKCDAQFKKINDLLRRCKDVTMAREGYTEMWQEFNKQEDFMKVNNLNYWTNYGDKTINYN